MYTYFLYFVSLFNFALSISDWGISFLFLVLDFDLIGRLRIADLLYDFWEGRLDVFDFVKDFYEDKISYFKKSSYGLQKTQTINNSLFTENPSSLLHSFFENKFNFRYQDNLNSELASVIPRINEILDIFEIHKIEFGIKQDDLIDEEQLTTDLTVSIVNWNADK